LDLRKASKVFGWIGGFIGRPRKPMEPMEVIWRLLMVLVEVPYYYLNRASPLGLSTLTSLVPT